MDIKKLGTILGVWAHPDDEAFISGGIMAQALRDNQRVVCITATKGERGGREKVISLEEMARIREKEMEDCLDVLGIKEHYFLGYIDGDCSKTNKDDAIKKILKIIREVNPDSILTFGPDGMTGHPDHQTVSRWTTKAHQMYGKGELFYAAVSRSWAKEFVPTMNKYNVFNPGFPKIVPDKSLSINLTLVNGLIEIKLGAIFAHKSQVDHMLKDFGVDFFVKSNQNETFRRA